jgi:hypothetical protein
MHYLAGTRDQNSDTEAVNGIRAWGNMLRGLRRIRFENALAAAGEITHPVLGSGASGLQFE